ncbi:MAG: hypothetical protein A3D52_00750 [Candidatus Taylorbacteria bacterium RIFCSPHIGHO2_02_FULL_44_36]|uniref:Uncharacterized protein n=1 Tax=Candidatus Taylorbacteria bacterium RIFCSPLOWO2_12_FULL_44_15c TaxID=1802333 RepID=A0A1G2P3K4_9BACT|nr:MAG: hypothetical protein A3D52_00750 [Candidatus Taylorbacteria bacterium RIFCSPHIGHO2_02_FULL_44_36]OHA37887.1 MAG: hypothetical protein A3I97_02590 [Candidatus Taylorbacteria bacterium RIFCSPLOWO2_02_FULL_44_35]OHA42910.1 MAG: hypothetical protein A3G03_00125 [Candidatus Taylorbacteria bacterium RIFCSPLOWO2_12_FULL_44_15c]
MLKEWDGIVFERRFFGNLVRRRQRVSARWPFNEALAYVKRSQKDVFNWNPIKPSTDLSERLFAAVKSNLSFHYINNLRLFVAAPVLTLSATLE